MATYQRERKQLADRLRALRQDARLSGAALARNLEWQQSKVSKIETGKQLPTEEDVRAWAAQTNGAVDELLGLLEGARVERTEFNSAFRSTGAAGVQAEILALETQVTRIGEFQPSMMSGLVQTAEYARESLHIPSGPALFGSSEDDIESIISLRLRRQQALYDPSKRVQIIMLESALRARLCSEETLAGQLDRLVALAGLAALELRIIPFDAAIPVFPMGFRIYDDELVIVESISGESKLDDPEVVAKYAHLFDLLRETGVSGGDAARLVQRALADLRN